MKQLIRQVTVVLPDSLEKNCDLLIEDGRIAAIGHNLPVDSNYEVLSFSGDIMIPGLIDTHVHGAGGQDAMDATPQSLIALRQALLREGTTAFLATSISSPFEQLSAALANIATANHDDLQAELLGVHLEGPFLTYRYKGAHIGDYLPPVTPGKEIAALTKLIDTYPDLIRIITFAIERTDASDLLALCQNHNIIASAGHTGADYSAMIHAAASGVRRLTHTFNAMPGIHHRDPGPITEGLLNPDIELEFIGDSVHIHPAILEMALRLKPQSKITLVSDGTRAVGMPNGQYELGGQMTIVENGTARLPDGTIAGSAYPLLQGVRTIVQVLKRPLYEAVRLASLNPAQTLGVSHRLGSLETGKEATFVRLDEKLIVKQVWLQGKMMIS